MEMSLNQTILDEIINIFLSNPYGFHEARKHHERALHYLHHDLYFKYIKETDHVFRWEFPTQQRYITEKIGTNPTKKLHINPKGEHGFIDTVIKDEAHSKIKYGFEYGLFDCDKSENDFQIKIENDVLKLTDPINSIENKYIIYFFRCDDFERTNKKNIQNRFNTVINRSKKFSEIIFEVCENAQTESLKAIYIEVFLIENKAIHNIRKFPNDY